MAARADARDPALAALVDELEADHRLVAPALADCATAADAYAGSAGGTARTELLEALADLASVLLPHLEREEAAMPLVSVAVTDAEWKAIDHEHFLAGKSTAELGFEGHWLLDGLDAERSVIVVGQVGPVVRLVLVHGFARRYRRYATACWGDTGVDAYRPLGKLAHRVGTSGRTETVVAVGPAAVWSVVADVTRVPEWSRECRRVEWLDGATAAAPGSGSAGENRAGPFRWRRTNEVIAADPEHRLVWRTVPTLLYPDSTEWRIELEPVGSGTRVVQSFDVLRETKLLSFLYSVLVPSHRDPRQRARRRPPPPRPGRDRRRGDRHLTDGLRWRRWDSNPRPPACKAGALAS